MGLVHVDESVRKSGIGQELERMLAEIQELKDTVANLQEQLQFSQEDDAPDFGDGQEPDPFKRRDRPFADVPFDFSWRIVDISTKSEAKTECKVRITPGAVWRKTMDGDGMVSLEPVPATDITDWPTDNEFVVEHQYYWIETDLATGVLTWKRGDDHPCTGGGLNANTKAVTELLDFGVTGGVDEIIAGSGLTAKTYYRPHPVVYRFTDVHIYGNA